MGVMRPPLRPAWCSHRGYASMFPPCAVLSWGLCERVSALRGTLIGVMRACFRPARCSHRGYASVFPPRFAPGWMQAEGVPSLSAADVSWVESFRLNLFHTVALTYFIISTQLSSKLMASRMSSFVSIGGRLIVNFTAFSGTWVWMVNCEP